MGNLTQAKEIIGIPNSTLVKTALNATGTAPIYACRAWVNFNGTGTVAIRASGNVSSITDNGTGDYTVNFITAMTDVNYVAGMSAQNRDPNNDKNIPPIAERKATSNIRSTSTFHIQVGNWLIGGYTGAGFDVEMINLTIHR